LFEKKQVPQAASAAKRSQVTADCLPKACAPSIERLDQCKALQCYISRCKLQKPELLDSEGSES
jgi:hypothetical protein